MYVVNGSDGRCLVAVRLIVGVRYLERPLREVLLYIIGERSEPHTYRTVAKNLRHIYIYMFFIYIYTYVRTSYTCR